MRVAPAAPHSPLAQVLDRVPVGVEPLVLGLVGIVDEEQTALLGDHQEEQAIDQPEELAVVGLGREGFLLEMVEQGRALGVLEQAGAENLERLLDALAQPLAHPAALLDPFLVPALEMAVVRGSAWCREAAAVDQAEKPRELGVLVAGGDALQVELEIDGPGEAGGVAQDAQAPAVGDDAPERIRAVEVVLDERMRREALLVAAAVEVVVEGGDVHGDRRLSLAVEMRDRVALPAELDVRALVFEVKVKEAE
jgi:hypothetical protein